MKPDLPSRTAEAVAYFRAAERLGSAPALDDPLAERFLSAPARLALRGAPLTRRLSLATYTSVRHRYMDDALGDALRAAGGVAQVVVLGAGYDARAWRFAEALAGRPIFELDHPATQARKVRLSAGAPGPAGDVRRIPIDFARQSIPDALAAGGFQRGRSTFFIWEGVTMYLREDIVVATLRSLSDLGGPGSRLALDGWAPPSAARSSAAWHRGAAALLGLIGEPITFPLAPPDAPALLARGGWVLVELVETDLLRRRYVHDGRSLYPGCFVMLAARAASVA